MIKIIFISIPFFLLVGCSATIESETNQEATKTEITKEIKLADYDSFYQLFEAVTLPYNLNFNKVLNCKNGHFCKAENQERIKDGNFINSDQLAHLTNIAHLNKDHRHFIDWCNSFKNELDDEWHQALPGVKITSEANTILTIYTYSKENHNGDGFWEVWLVKMNANNELSDFKKLGLMGYSSFLDAGEEEDSEYSIFNIDHEYISVEFTSLQYNITLKRWSTREGYDWRVDQNLKINDSTSLDDVQLAFSY